MHETVADVIRQALESKQINQHGAAHVHEFPKEIPELSGYLIRHSGHLIRHLPIESNLSRTSSLYPVKKFVTCMHVGQPLSRFEADPKLSIMLRQPGVTLADWKLDTLTGVTTKTSGQSYSDEQNERFARYAVALVDMFHEMEVRRANPFLKVFDETYKLGLLGLERDAHAANILLDTDPASIGIIDQFNSASSPMSPAEQGRRNIAGFRREFVRNIVGVPFEFHTSLYPQINRDPLDNDLERELAERQEYFTARVTAAEEQILNKYAEPNASSIAFGNVESVKAVRLSDPPAALIEHLRRLESLTALPKR